ncbi:asparaginase [Rhizomonospora bruguierae]|uniref:asparaginase n=1 Tax=Rhizomonospora bruguierae TaxID=1581705 RepID=UPI001BD13604|nr:asparaginase [Micromonospora sp. NBRC 107566]
MGKIYAGGVPLAEVVRSGFTEGVHRGSLVVLDASGAPVFTAGDVQGPIFPRSSNKPMQAVGMLRAGLRLCDAADLAMVAASHRGEPVHLERVAALLRSGGLTEDALACPPDLPGGQEAREAYLAAGGTRARIAMNCSGKHAGMLLTCLGAGWPTEGYADPGHPLQRLLVETVAEFTGAPGEPPCGVDGCGAVVTAASLTGLATAFLRLVGAEPGSAERTVVDAMRGYPVLVSGTGEPDAVLMAGVPGALAKGGAEGVWVVAVPGAGAVAVKIDDGAHRASVPVTAAALSRLGVEAPEGLRETPVHGGGRRVGAVRPIAL